MCLESVKAEIRSAVEKLKLPTSVFRELPDKEAEEIYWKALRFFVSEGEPRWWWEHFVACTCTDFPAGDGWRHIPEFVPDTSERVWFIVEDDSLSFYPVYKATPTAICEVIGECYAFEYYIVQREFQWLLCETHHNTMIAVGEVVEMKLRGLRA